MSKLVQVKVKHEKFKPETGEFYEVEEEIYTRPDVPFRSITDLKGFIDDEINTSDSLVDETGYEPLEHLIQRMQRGDISALLQGARSIYGDVSKDMSDDEAFATEDITQSDGFDISDIPTINDELVSARKQRQASEAKRGADTLAENSEDVSKVEKTALETPQG